MIENFELTKQYQTTALQGVSQPYRSSSGMVLAD